MGIAGALFLARPAQPEKAFWLIQARNWEAAALVARGVGIRVAHLRISLVLSGERDILCRLLPWFKVGLGVALDSGYQCMSWIAIGDLNTAINETLCNKSLSGPITYGRRILSSIASLRRRLIMKIKNLFFLIPAH
ncbi:cell division inhibitor [Syntrophus aciditrophicus SB]|uniref:Cell division inhibitor n=1 Tax=Syntrophus aciditrophicus (strain SB) TaxID=56780 RepID=Q2LS15_SYNAS|nr:cell division inhibitor [Syntrophus aciditrophicus SB]